MTEANASEEKAGWSAGSLTLSSSATPRSIAWTNRDCRRECVFHVLRQKTPILRFGADYAAHRELKPPLEIREWISGPKGAYRRPCPARLSRQCRLDISRKSKPESAKFWRQERICFHTILDGGASYVEGGNSFAEVEGSRAAVWPFRFCIRLARRRFVPNSAARRGTFSQRNGTARRRSSSMAMLAA